MLKTHDKKLANKNEGRHHGRRLGGVRFMNETLMVFRSYQQRTNEVSRTPTGLFLKGFPAAIYKNDVWTENDVSLLSTVTSGKVELAALKVVDVQKRFASLCHIQRSSLLAKRLTMVYSVFFSFFLSFFFFMLTQKLQF